VLEQNIMVAEHMTEEVAHLMAARNNSLIERGKRAWTRCTLQRHIPVTYFLQLGPTSLSPLSYELIDGFIHL
jgi:hypothetical protein